MWSGLAFLQQTAMIKAKTPRKKSKDSLFTRINKWLHLWLGLASGIVVFIVCITACIWVFNEEIMVILEPEKNIEQEDRPVLKPSQLAAIGMQRYPDLVIDYIYYQQGRALTLNMEQKHEEGEEHGGVVLNINPYSGKIISTEAYEGHDNDFFSFILKGHRFLWFPYEIGRPIVNYSTLIFVVLMITGLIWWYPKKWNKSTRDKSFKIKWGASFKRVNLDLHNVLGFYSLIFLLVLALTGMVFGITWYSEGLYWLTSGGESLGEYEEMHSDSTQVGKFYTPSQAIDKAWDIVIKAHPKSQGFYYNYPNASQPKGVIDVTVYPDKSQFYSYVGYNFDQHTLKQLKGTGPDYVAYKDAGFGGKLRRMNYDIHVGAILGLPGKVLAFFAALIGASLPITGFLIWYGRKFKKKK